MTKTSPQITIFTGRFGSGKTEIALNCAVALSKRGLDPYLIDLDIVTPYFRTRDRAAEMAGLGVQVVSPFPAGHHLHIPAINPQIQGAIEQSEHPVVIDLGGDEQGVRALAPYARQIRARARAMHFVVNPYRPTMDTVSGIERAVQAIATSAHLSVTDLISNPNLMSQSSPELFVRGHRLVDQASQQLDLPIAFAVVTKALSEQLDREQLGVELVVIHRYFLMFDAAESGNEAGGEGLS
ncbi:MAG TPA: hypothetical protein VM366_16275 [Anaerolineae bacterium]|nr:hypothetical protein [Anaerolineae bacterium]